MANKKRDLVWVTFSGYYSIAVSIVKNFVFAYFLSTIDYAFVQTYILYAGYSWIFILGFTDGILIKYGDYDFNEIPYIQFRSYTWLLFISQGIVCILISLVGFFVNSIFLFVNIAFSIFTSNLCSYFSTINVFTTRFDKDSIDSIIYNTSINIFIIFAIITKKMDNTYPIIFLNISNIIYLILLMSQNKEIIKGKRCPFRHIMREVYDLIKIGFFVTLNVTIGRIVMSIDKFFVSFFFTSEDFANYSFAVSIMNMFFAVINASSKIIFPYLKRIAQNNEKHYYQILNEIFTSIACISCGSFFLINLVVHCVLPKYVPAMNILRVLFPCLIFKILFNTVSNNFYKLLQCVKEYTKNGLLALISAFITDIFLYLIFRSCIALACASVLTFIIWYIINEYFFNIKLKLSLKSNLKKYTMILLSLIFYYILLKFNYTFLILYLLITAISSYLLFRDSYKKVITSFVRN